MLADAPNYSETAMEFPDREAGVRYAFTVQRVGKLTPHEARRAAEAECERLRAELAKAQQAARRPGVTLTRDQLEAWAGRALTDDDVDRLQECIPNSSVTEAIDTIVGSFYTRR